MVENGKLCRFWQDCWIMEVALKIAFADLYRLADNAECMVVECWVEEMTGILILRDPCLLRSMLVGWI